MHTILSLLLSANVTFHPTAVWLRQQLVEAFPWDTAPQYLIRDRDGAYGTIFRDRLETMNIVDVPTAPRSPWQNAYVERVIGSIRRECLDHVIVLNAPHLRRILSSYFDYYNTVRPHSALAGSTPAEAYGAGRPVDMMDKPEGFTHIPTGSTTAAGCDK